MKVERIEMLIETGEFVSSKEFQDIRAEILLGIEAVDWFETGKFVINPTALGNGVTIIKKNFVTTLREHEWKPEVKLSLVEGVGKGPIDAVKDTTFGLFAVEWETGNVSSSHRALNKMASGILQGQLIGGFLVLPMRQLSRYLTDRIGNFEELFPYFLMYKSLPIRNGFLGVIGVTYDEISSESPLIPKGKDGNAEKTTLVETKA